AWGVNGMRIGGDRDLLWGDGFSIGFRAGVLGLDLLKEFIGLFHSRFTSNGLVNGVINGVGGSNGWLISSCGDLDVRGCYFDDLDFIFTNLDCIKFHGDLFHGIKGNKGIEGLRCMLDHVVVLTFRRLDDLVVTWDICLRSEYYSRFNLSGGVFSVVFGGASCIWNLFDALRVLRLMHELIISSGVYTSLSFVFEGNFTLDERVAEFRLLFRDYLAFGGMECMELNRYARSLMLGGSLGFSGVGNEDNKGFSIGYRGDTRYKLRQIRDLDSDVVDGALVSKDGGSSLLIEGGINLVRLGYISGIIDLLYRGFDALDMQVEVIHAGFKVEYPMPFISDDMGVYEIKDRFKGRLVYCHGSLAVIEDSGRKWFLDLNQLIGRIFRVSGG
ncbi:MAG: hypothetical protein ACTSRA_19240, partial [Promethearchaeota archaeon]